jgi:hypothetical protein
MKHKGGNDGRTWSRQEESGAGAGDMGGVAMAEFSQQRWESSA